VPAIRILAVNQFYAPDPSATSQLLTELCEDLVRGGDEVTVVASRTSHLGPAKLPARDRIAGVDVLRPWAMRLGKRTMRRRLADYLTFWTSAVGRLALARRPDVVLALTTPPLIAAGAAAVARARELPLVLWVQDVYPEAAVALGVLRRDGAAVGALSALARFAHGVGRFSVALADDMARRLEAQGQRPERVRVIQNWADGRAVACIGRAESPLRRELGGAGRFIAMYSGNIGLGHDVETLVGAARILAERSAAIGLVFVGDGARRAEAQRAAHGLPNVRFLPSQPRARLTESLAAADVHLASLRDGLEGLLVPSKIYGVLAAGRPLFFVGPAASEPARLVREHAVGWEGRPGDPAALASALERARDDAVWTAACGRRARALLEARFDRPLAVARWRELLLEAAHPRR
jgi:glycosyltransferase involved in cell wall biosynthesis